MTRAFVLSGGASLGAVQVGMLRALAERGIHPDLVVGASAGAINAALLAAVVLLATRTALGNHAETIAVVHMMGATDPQVARIFQRQAGGVGRQDRLAPVARLDLGIEAALEVELLGDRLDDQLGRLVGKLGGAGGTRHLLGDPLGRAA